MPKLIINPIILSVEATLNDGDMRVQHPAIMLVKEYGPRQIVEVGGVALAGAERPALNGPYTHVLVRARDADMVVHIGGDPVASEVLGIDVPDRDYMILPFEQGDLVSAVTV